MHQVDSDTTRAPFLVVGGDTAWIPRTPVLGMTRALYVPTEVDGRAIKPLQRTKSGGKGRPAKAPIPSQRYWVSRDVTVR